MRKRMRILAAGAAAAVLAGTLAACGSSGSMGTEDSKTITYWSTWNKGEPQQQVIQQAIGSFTKETGIKVRAQFSGRQVMKQVDTANNTSKVPDLVDDSSESLLSAANSGVLQGVDAVYGRSVPGESKTVAQVIPPASVKFLKDDKGQYALVPYQTLVTSLWFNDKMMQKIGATPPKTFDELLDTCGKAVAHGMACVADDGTIPDYNAYWLTQLVSRYLGPEWIRKAAADKTGQTWRDPKFLAAAQALEKLVKGKGNMLSGYQGSKLPAGQQAWSQNKALYLLMGSWAASDTKNYAASGFDYDSVTFPSVPNGQMSVDSQSVGFGITKKAKNPAAAQKFIAYFMSKRWMSELSSKAGVIPSRPDVPAPATLASVQKQLADAPVVTRYLDGVPSIYPNYWTNVFDVADDQLFFGETSPEKFVDKLVSSSKSYWASHS
ncbi:extracellular solute-binding protein [Streptomyces cocklensis]|uniref:Raffinose/stachyose/melibiose transport system substrate-binding protein n=1 Tax=Actinacidiphila cocklensis TaxID=887465 RepID=A0A9W4DU64_9ACTN|nr:extracellular solute-binding protein [Actinacidiphila cocklensis]MDD1063199.1 extracellular solute-binding protein [Actinacidiphila cocklensis]CAG6393625.1 Raffinose/stachyose/melibiose transport system substrate-binding protein [Actinacidiphila cocklensis]